MESSMINLSQYRYEKADYYNFFAVSYEMAKEQLEKAKTVIQMELPYLEGKWKE